MTETEIEIVEAAGKRVVLVGTAHISKKSIELVEKTIESEKPDMLGIELDVQRLHQLLHRRKWQETDIARVIKEGKTYLFLINILLSNLQRQLGQEVGIQPGSEMLQAVKIAKEKNIPVVLLDRSVRVTLKRAMNEMRLTEKIKLFYSIVSGFFSGGQLTAEKVEELKQKDTMNALMQELSRELPSLRRVLVDERDAYIANKIIAAKAKKIVAVVGLGHVQGIRDNLCKETDVSGLETIPEKKSRLKYLKYLVPVLFIAFIAYALYFKGIETTLHVFAIWFLVNGLLSALGALIAHAHPLSVLTAFIAAPFTSLHLAIAAGWFAGLAEAKLRMPKVKDFEELPSLGGYRGYMKNRVFRILLVTALTNIGSTIGTVIALPYMLALLA